MAELVFKKEKITDKEKFVKTCPFGALSFENGEVSVSSACKMCKICVKAGFAELHEEEVKKIDKSEYNGICVYVDHDEGEIHPVTYELIGKSLELAKKLGHKVYCIFMGHNVSAQAEKLLHYGVDAVYVYDNPSLKDYITEAYTSVFEDFINNVKPSIILVGATSVGRQLAPRVAARFKTGLTADCTVLDVTEDADLVQIRPAFGGNIMAEIHTPNNRPQMATVRYKVMDAPTPADKTHGKIINCEISDDKIKSNVKIIDVVPKPKIKTIEQAEVLVVCGRGVKSQNDISVIERLANLLGGEIAFTRPMIEAGWGNAKRQIGLSGRTVRPKLIITCGVSGAVQFTAGMNNAECIISINKDENAPIFKIAHYGIVGDIYEIVPELIKNLEVLK